MVRSTPHSQPPPMLPVANPTPSLWQTSHKTPVAHFHSTPTLPSHATVVVIGSGISSVFAAKELLSSCPSTTSVLVLEARGICSGATGRNGGHLLPHSHDEDLDVVDFELRNVRYITELIERAEIPCDFRRLSGVLGFWNSTYFEETKQSVKDFQLARPDLVGLATIVEDPEQLQKLRLKGAVGAVVQSVAASLSPYKLVTWLWEELVAKYPNLNLQADTVVTEIQPREVVASMGGAWNVKTPHTMVTADYLLLTTNGYTAHLLPQFRDLITPLQLTMSALRPPPSSKFSKTLLPHSYGMNGVGLMDRVQDDHLVQQPFASGGQFMFGGARAVVDGNGVGIWDDSYVDERARRHLRTQLSVLLDLDKDQDGVSGSELISDGEWSGIPGYSRDQRPWAGGVPGIEGAFLCAGYTGHGMPNASLCGKHVASLIASAIHGHNWKETERQALATKQIPGCYAITEKRMAQAHSLPTFPLANPLQPPSPPAEPSFVDSRL